MNYAPVTLFVYNRPEHTRQTVDALKKNATARDSDLIIFSDAAKTAAQGNSVAEVRKYIRTIEGFKSVSIVEREANFGLAKSVIAGVTAVINKYGRIIVLEDDLLVTPSFLDFMNRALDKYENENRVMQISGYMFPVESAAVADTFFLPFTTSWGWATWKRAWSVFDKDAAGYAMLMQDAGRRKSFDLDGAYPYFDMLEMQQKGKIDSWAIRWWLSVFLHQGLILYPRISRVFNIGFDGTGVHCNDARVSQMELAHTSGSIIFPPGIAVDLQAQARIYRYLSGVSKTGLRGRFRKLLNLFKVSI